MTTPLFLTLEDVLEIHAYQVARHGGREGVRDEGLLRSAVAQPQVTFDGSYLHEDLCAMAAAYAFHIAQAQAFFDGSKRTAIDAALTFLRVNGLAIGGGAVDALEKAMLDIAEHRLGKSGLAALFRKLAREVPFGH